MSHYMVCLHDVHLREFQAFYIFARFLFTYSIDYQENIFLGIIVSVVLVMIAIC